MTIWSFDWNGFWATAGYLSWFEVGMLACFGAGWPFSIHKMLTTGQSGGKSRLFLALILLGYVFGILHKLFYHLDVVVILYMFLFFLVFADLMLSLRYQR